MDPTEDLSARVLLKHVLNTETPRTPVTRSATKTQTTTPPRRSARPGSKDPGAQTPQDILRRSLRHKLRESITRKSLPPTKRRTASVVLRRTNTPAPTSMLVDDGDTPRHILMSILQTEPARSPVVHKNAVPEKPLPSSASSSMTRKRPSTELSGLDLPDVTIGNVASMAKGLSRKRPRRSLNVTAFEKRLRDRDGVEEENEQSIGDHSSLSLSSSTSLSLKTPCVDVQTEKRGLQRRVSNRRKITADEFGAAVNKRQMKEVSSFVEQGPSETVLSEGFTLGISKLSEPDLTTDIIHCKTALYAKSDAVTSNFSIVATQDKSTVMMSQLQGEMEVKQGKAMEADHDMWVKERSIEGEVVIQSEKDVAVSQSDKEEEDTPDSQTEDDDAVDSPIEQGEEPEADAQSEEDAVAKSQSDDEGDNRETQTEELAAVDSQSEEKYEIDQKNPAVGGSTDSHDECDYDGEIKEEGDKCVSEQLEPGLETRRAHHSGSGIMQSEKDVNMSQSDEEEEDTPGSGTEEDDAVDSPVEQGEENEADVQSEEDAVANSQSDDEVVDRDTQTEELAAVDSQSEEEYEIDQENLAEGGSTDSHVEVEYGGEIKGEDDKRVSEQVEQSLANCRALHSGSGIMPITESGRRDASHKESDAGDENYFHASNEDEGNLCDDPPEEAAAQDPDVQEDDEWEDGEDEENEEVPSKTPAFVREKRKIVNLDHLRSSSVHKNIQSSLVAHRAGEGLPASKPKQTRRRSRSTAKNDGLPKNYLMNVFKHFAKTKVSADVYPVLKEIMDKYFERLAEDLETYALHAKRKTIEVEDVELLLRRQGHVNDKVPVEVLIEKYLRMDQRKLLIPIATSGNVVVPKSRR
ncbi:centromere protein T [Antennarius striatus]|uniref:centromere protein T n=1 Tax=Antennarius striatus TaxID=241820 RepID=UPI0035AEF5EB